MILSLLLIIFVIPAFFHGLSEAHKAEIARDLKADAARRLAASEARMEAQRVREVEIAEAKLMGPPPPPRYADLIEYLKGIAPKQ